jgi:hypothetical protein
LSSDGENPPEFGAITGHELWADVNDFTAIPAEFSQSDGFSRIDVGDLPLALFAPPAGPVSLLSTAQDVSVANRPVRLRDLFGPTERSARHHHDDLENIDLRYVN